MKRSLVVTASAKTASAKTASAKTASTKKSSIKGRLLNTIPDAVTTKAIFSVPTYPSPIHKVFHIMSRRTEWKIAVRLKMEDFDLLALIKHGFKDYAAMVSDKESLFFSIDYASNNDNNDPLADFSAQTRQNQEIKMTSLLNCLLRKVVLFNVHPDCAVVPIAAIDDPCYLAFIVEKVLTGLYTLTALKRAQCSDMHHGYMLYERRVNEACPPVSCFLVSESPEATREFYQFNHADNQLLGLHPAFKSEKRYQLTQDEELSHFAQRIPFGTLALLVDDQKTVLVRPCVSIRTIGVQICSRL